MRPNRPGGPIRWRLHLLVPPARVYQALDSDVGRASFWAESAVERAGSIEFRFSDGSTWIGRIIQRDPPRTWAVDYMGGPARFELAPDGRGGTDLLLTQSGLDGDDWFEAHAGWLNVLLPLKAWLVHGVDLRNHDPGRTWDRGYVDQ